MQICLSKNDVISSLAGVRSLSWFWFGSRCKNFYGFVKWIAIKFTFVQLQQQILYQIYCPVSLHVLFRRTILVDYIHNSSSDRRSFSPCCHFLSRGNLQKSYRQMPSSNICNHLLGLHELLLHFFLLSACLVFYYFALMFFAHSPL